MEMYLLKSAACLAVLLLFYKLLLEKENMHVFKRFYLLASAVTAIGIPLITFTTYVELYSENINLFTYSSETFTEIPAQTINYWPYILLGIYLLGVLFFGIKFYRNLRGIIKKIRINPKLKSGNFINVLLSEKIHPHTFFNFIFFNKEKYLLDQIPKDVKIHEEAHASQKHSLDVLLVELLQIIYWFNPLIFLLKDAMKLNHEFLADREVIKKGIPTSRYQQTLLAYSSGDLQCDLVNPINYSSIKKRFSVMKKQTSKRAIWIRSLLLIPLLALLIYSCSNTQELEIPIEKNAIEENSQEIASPEMVSQYNNIVKKYNSQEKPFLKTEDFKKMLQIYDRMSLEQKQVAENFKEVMIDSDEEVIKVVVDADPATPAMIVEYNNLAKVYLSREVTATNVEIEEFQRLLFIYNKMTPEQRKTAIKLPPPPPPSPIESVKEWIEEGAAFLYNGRSISGKEALEMVQKNNGKNLSVHVEENNSQKTIRLSDKKDTVPPQPASPTTPSAENGFYYTAALSPPPQNSNTLEYVKELAKRGASFYIGPHKYSQEEVIKMVTKSTNEVSIDVSKYPVVVLNGC